MVPLTWLPLVLILCLAVFGLAGYWGTNVLFHPPNMLPHTLWPEQFGFTYEAVAFSTNDGIKLRGWLIPCARATRRTILCCHGWGDNKGDLLKRIHFLGKGFNLFLFDSRSHGESGGDITGNSYLEARDFDAALRFLKAARPEWASRLGVFGLSMGAVMAVRGMAEHPDFRCAVFESPFRSYRAVAAQFTWNNYRLPFFPFVWAILLVARLRLGGDPESCSPSLHVRRLSGRPILFIAAENDPLMPVSVVRSLYDDAGKPKEFYLSPGAFHGGCWEADAEGYRRKLMEFFEKNL
ncbi:MAG: alpha/beta hydrolase [Elusimicrobia bacterium]|nr:alpha/beta hydrolase [Elusimicrobiota bacterium]